VGHPSPPQQEINRQLVPYATAMHHLRVDRSPQNHDEAQGCALREDLVAIHHAFTGVRILHSSKRTTFVECCCIELIKETPMPEDRENTPKPTESTVRPREGDEQGRTKGQGDSRTNPTNPSQKDRVGRDGDPSNTEGQKQGEFKEKNEPRKQGTSGGTNSGARRNAAAANRRVRRNPSNRPLA